jgi:hypothetical protein
MVAINARISESVPTKVFKLLLESSINTTNRKARVINTKFEFERAGVLDPN